MLPWNEMWRYALSKGVSPAAFWHLSVREWLWLTEDRKSAFSSARLNELVREHPDE